MKFFVVIALLGFASCNEQSRESKSFDTAILDDFRVVVDGGKFEDLAPRIHPEILKTFRRRLEFATSFPLEGSWFTGSRDRLPTKQDLESLSDTDFFVRFMSGYEPVLGNPFKDALMSLQVVATTSGSKGYRGFVATKETDYAIPVTFMFSQVEGKWVLVSPSFVEHFANSLRAARGQTPEG